MKQFLDCSPAVIEAREKKGLVWPLEILVFIAVFIAVTLGELLIMVPGQIGILSMDTEYRAAVLADDVQGQSEALLRIASSDILTILMLFSTIMMVLIVWLFTRFVQKRKITSLGFYRQGAVKEYLWGLGAGLLLFSAAVLLCVLTGAVRIEGFSADFSPGIFLLFVLGFMIQGMAEEVLCRGYFLVSVARRYSVAAAVLINSTGFAALHLFNAGITPLAFLNLVLFGIFASLLFIRRGSIWMVGALHSVWNLAQGNVYGIRVSGMNISCSVFTSALDEKKQLLHGGSFGLEGGLAVTIILLAAIVLVYFMKKETAGTGNEAEQKVLREAG